MYSTYANKFWGSESEVVVRGVPSASNIERNGYGASAKCFDYIKVTKYVLWIKVSEETVEGPEYDCFTVSPQ